MKALTIWVTVILVLFLRLVVYFQSQIRYPDGTKLKIVNKVVSEPVRFERSQYLRINYLKIYLPLYPEVNYGDFVVIEGIVENNKLLNARLISVEANTGSVYELRKRILVFLKKSMPEPSSSLLAGMTIGSKASMSTEFWDALKNSGTAHVVVASGMNITLVAGFLMGTLVLLVPRRKAVPLAITGIWLYSMLAGFGAPIIRAAIMGSIAFSAQEFGKIYFALRALLLTAFVMILIWPEWIFDLGFILSFLATLSLILFESRINKRLGRIPKAIRTDLSTTLAAQIGVAPVMLLTFGQFNILSPLINVLVLWTVPLITVIGMISALIGLIFEPVGKVLILLAYPLTSWFIFIVKLFS